MAAWKQILFAIAILMAAAVAGYMFVPGSAATLARLALGSVENPATATGSIGGQEEQGARAVSVVTAPVSTATINDRLSAIGTGRARATVSVTPYGSGRLTELLVQSGAHVETGQVIARLDSATEEIAVDRARAARDDAVARVERIRQLRTSNAATQVQLTDAELALRNAELTLHDAEVALDRRSVTSPITGIVGILPIEAGNYVTSQTSIATIDDRSSILVDFHVPERFAAMIEIGAPVRATPLANPNREYAGTVTAIDNRVDEKSRTLWVQATIANPSDSLRAGMSFQIAMQFPGESYPAVSPLAVQWGSEGAFIWAVEDGKAKRVPVRIIQRNTESVLVDAPILAGSIVVTEGVQSVREGGGVRIAGDPARTVGADG
ncbi:efflux RND transporter periplasmic adaptor subunit [Aquamicrobium defluvii]|uniref:RND family efflux transporter MFP subunit n=1 Tax=Aquamicrobium defluvii TaxID=69279 RepID=A0A011UUQ8_9HYPH|nr:efflux RND transporter periplasmic adaptor subunit [Aquamicrobium defluvii]EXL09618.1 secretion protein HylD [Aquamicrobium defluvii]EZQ16348.1 secretion protein HylD [Halopseudomonas bauzanensis]TDR36894.1 RND family efflux transporter MFP subunit [Aquamicrobium defluvii]